MLYASRMMGNPDPNYLRIAVLTVIKVLSFGTPSYINNLILIPRLLQRQRIKLYVGALLGTMVAFLLVAIPLHHSVHWLFPLEPSLDPDAAGGVSGYFMELVMFILVLGLFDMARVSLTYKRKLETMQKERLELELEHLRAQINPHFLFNSLNTIYGLSTQDRSITPKAILQLSDILRFVLYECDVPSVPIAKELDFIRNYIAFSSLRAGEELSVTCEYPEEGHEDIQVPPLLFMPLIENAFKHSTGEVTRWLKLSILRSGDHLVMRCSNSMVAGQKQPPHIKTGLGLENVKKRLRLLFEDRFEFETTRLPTEYQVYLKMPITHA